MGEEGMQDLREENRLKKAQTAVKSNDLFHGQSSDSDTTPISSLDSMASSPSTSDFMEDASSPASYSSSTASSSSSLLINDNGPLSDLSQLMAKLPLKRGLSEYYEGKSQSFTCLASANSLEDLAKKENPCNKRIKMCSKGYGGGLDLDGHFSERFCSDPKAAITSFPMKSTDNSSISGVTVSAAMARRRGTRHHHDLLLRMHA